MTIDNVLAAIAVKDFEKALTWYERLLDRPSDPVPAEMKGLAEWRFSDGADGHCRRTPNQPGGEDYWHEAFQKRRKVQRLLAR